MGALEAAESRGTRSRDAMTAAALTDGADWSTTKARRVELVFIWIERICAVQKLQVQ